MTIGQYVKLRLGLISEGRLIEEIDEDLIKAQAELVQRVKEYGDLAEKTKASVVVKIDLVCENAKDFAFAIKTTSRMIPPPRPASVSLAIAEDDAEKGPSLFVRKSGSSSTTPRQKVMTTDDGRRVDPDTGEIVAGEKK